MNFVFSQIIATIIPENISSIKLLKKIVFAFEKAIKVDKERLHIYCMSIIN